jgi:hypothetical protein
MPVGSRPRNLWAELECAFMPSLGDLTGVIALVGLSLSLFGSLRPSAADGRYSEGELLRLRRHRRPTVSPLGIWPRVGSLVAASLLHWNCTVLGRLALPLGLVAVVAGFWIGHVGAAAAPRVQVWPKEDAKPSAGSPLASADLIRGCSRLLLHNQDRLFLVRPLKGATAADLPVLTIPWDQVALIRVLAEYTSCE